MSKEFDYNRDEMDEHVCILPLPVSNPHSLNSSRRMDNNPSSHRKVLMDLEQFIQASKIKEEERMQEMKKRQKNLGDEINRRLEIKEYKLKQLQKEQKERMLKECTFHPTTTQTRNKQKRNFNEFLESQKAHTQKIKEKKEMMKKQLEDKKEKNTFRPKINESTGKRKESRENAQPVHERLYALREKQNVVTDNQSTQNMKFHPKINQRSKNMIRNGPIDQLLYSDAVRRQEKGNEMMMSTSFVGSKMEKSSNFNNERYAAQKFIRQFFFTLEDLRVDPSLSASVEYVMFNELLKQMGFMTNEEEFETKATSAERSLVHDAYEILEKYQVNARNICVFLLALLGIYHINPVNFEEGQEPDQSKELNFDEIEGRKIQKHFDLFYRNRLSSEVARRNEERAEEHSFQPKINKQSVELAEKYRNNMLEEANELIEQYPQIDFSIPEDGVISHTDLLVLHKMAKDIEKERIKYDREAQKMKECTFKPNTFASSLSNSKMSESIGNGLVGYKKSHELYEYHKSLLNKKQSMRVSRSDIDPECTFKPQINKNRIPLESPGQVSKQTDQTLYRLFKGRHDYEEKKKFLERGEPLPKQRTQTSEIEDRIPSLILDVNLGQKIDRIALYKGDEDRLPEIAQEFAQKHGIDEESQIKLLEMLRAEMENILLKIEEDEQSEEGDI